MRNGFVDLIKLILSVIVCFYHFYNIIDPNPYLPRGDLAVELFVLIAGVFLFISIDREKTQYGMQIQKPYEFLKKRFIRLLPYSFGGFVVALIVKIYLNVYTGAGFSTDLLGKWLSDGIWDVLMIKMNGMNNNSKFYNVPTWTLSAMLISEYLTCACVYNNAKSYETIVIPVSVVVGLGIWRHIPEAKYEFWLGFTTFGLLRVWIIYCLSWYCYRIMCKIQKIQWTKVGVQAITACEFVCYGIALNIMMFQVSRNYRWVATLVMMVAISISISGKSLSASIFKRCKLTRCFAKLSMGIYITHYPIMQLFRGWFPGSEILEQVISFSTTVLIGAIIFVFITDKAKLSSAKLCQTAISKLVEENTDSSAQ